MKAAKREGFLARILAQGARRRQGEGGPENFEERIALDLLAVLEAEVPDVNAAVVGEAIAAEARRREGQNARAWGDRQRAGT